jgi:serine/threonine protein phosphatase 1
MEPTQSPAGDVGVLPPLTPGLRVYAIGDIHGRLDLLKALTAEIRADLETRPPAHAVEVYLGDYIDRGPHSRAVVEWLIAAPPLAAERICLLGNHEELLLGALTEPGGIARWLSNGGLETMVSYGVAVAPGATVAAAALREDFARSFPATHERFLRSLPRMARFGPYVFVHAGIRPGRPLDAQDPADLVWIRDPFLNSDAGFGFVVVHGHTPARLPEIRRNRINVDTGAVFTGCLTALVLEGTAARFIQARVA